MAQVLQLRSAQSDESLQCLCAQVFQRLARAPAPARMDRPRRTWKHPAARQESLDGRKDLRRCVRCGFQSYIRKVGCVVFGCVAYYMNKPVEKRQSPWKRGRGESTSVYTPQEWYQKMSWVEEKAIRSSLQEPDSDSESEKGDAEAASASKPDVPVIDVGSSDEQSLGEIPDALAAAEEAPAEETPAEKASAEEAPAEEAPGKAPAEEAEAMDADTEDVANEPQRKRIRRKRPPQPVPVPKLRPMNILDVAPSEESAPGAPVPWPGVRGSGMSQS